MHRTAVVLILVVTGIAEGNLRFLISPLGHLIKTQTHTHRFVSIHEKQTPLWKRAEKSTTDAYFMALNVSCVVGFVLWVFWEIFLLMPARCCCPFLSLVSKVGTAARGATRKMGFARSQGSAGSETTSDSRVDDGSHPAVEGFATLFP